jgi:anti-sigma B factor antagonist
LVPGIRVTTLRIAGGAYVCSVAGELDADSAETLREELTTVADQGGRHVIADLVDVTFLDSAGLELLFTTSDRLKHGGGELVVVCDDPRTLRVFEVTGSGHHFRISRSLADAVDELSGRLLTTP